MSRSCGACTACCVVLEIRQLDKPAHQQCLHCSVGTGCQIYSARPDTCQQYECEWKRGLGSESHRPDLLGIIINTVEIANAGFITVISEVNEGAIKSPAVASIIGAVLDVGAAVFLHPLPSTELREQIVFPEDMTQEEQRELCEAAKRHFERKE